MADETKTYVFGNGEGATVPAWYAMNGNNGLLGGSGLAGGAVGFILGLLFGNGGFGNFGFGGGRGVAADNHNTDVVLSAIQGTDADVRQLATSSGYSLLLVKLLLQKSFSQRLTMKKGILQCI